MHNPIRTWWLKHQAKVIAPYLQQIEGFKVQRQKDEVVIVAQRYELAKFRNDEDLAIRVIERVLKRGIEWYDPTTLDYGGQVTYRKHAEDVLNNPTLQNEIRKLQADWVMFASKEAPDFSAVRDIRMSIIALELLQERLAHVPDPRKKQLNEDPFNAV